MVVNEVCGNCSMTMSYFIVIDGEPIATSIVPLQENITNLIINLFHSKFQGD